MAGKRPGRPPHEDILTPAEWRIAHAVRHGMGNREIARRQGVSADAVKFHVSNILGKLGLADRAALRGWRGWPKESAMADGTTETTDLQIGGIGQISRSVADIAVAEAWYRDVLGLTHLYTFGQMAFFDCGGTRLMLSAETADPPHVSIVYFDVPDIHTAERILAARGVGFVSAPHMIHRHADGTEEWMAFFNDPDGRPLGLMSRARAAD